MIAKISATENLGGALGYNFKKVEKGEASILLAQGLYQNKEGTYTMAEVFPDMQALIPEKCRTKKMVFHCSLNPHPDDKISDEQLVQVAREYMEALGYGNQPYIVFKHSDIAREHIHIVSLRVDSRGQKINDKFEKRRSKQITDALERKFGLIPSSKVTEKAVAETPKVDIGKGNIKEQVANVVRMMLKHYCFCSLGELNAILSKYNLAVEEIKTEFDQWLQNRRFAPAIQALKQSLEALKEGEIDFQRKKITDFNEAQASMISDRIIQKITTKFINHLKESSTPEESLHFIKQVFEL